MLSSTLEKMMLRNEIKYCINNKLYGLLIGERCKEIYEANERQIAFIKITGYAFNFQLIVQLATPSSNFAAGFLRLCLGIILATFAETGLKYALNLNLKTKDPRIAVISAKGCISYKQIIPLFVMIVGLNYIGKYGFAYLASFLFSSSISQAAGFVMANLVSIYPAFNLRSNEKANVSTQSGLMGFMAFCVGATTIYFTNSHSSNTAMFLLKAIPIFLACTEAIYLEKYGIEIIHEEQTKLRMVTTCALGSALLTAAFVSGDCLVHSLYSENIGVIHSPLKIVAEIFLMPTAVIVTSLVCRAACNYIAYTPSSKPSSEIKDVQGNGMNTPII